MDASCSRLNTLGWPMGNYFVFTGSFTFRFSIDAIVALTTIHLPRKRSVWSLLSVRMKCLNVGLNQVRLQDLLSNVIVMRGNAMKQLGNLEQGYQDYKVMIIPMS